MANLTIHLLGTFQVLRDGEPLIGFESDKVRGLLAYLVMEAERPFRREALAGLLWPNMPEAKARGNLRRALKNLRDVIGDRDAKPPFLSISRTVIQFNRSSNYQLDVTQFLQKPDSLDNIQLLQAAVARYQGDFLAGFSIGDSTSFEEWLLLKREQLCRDAWEAHHTLAKHEAVNGRFSQALHYAQRQIEIEPWQESSHRQLMRYLTFTHRHNEAVAHFHTFRSTLKTELNVAPDAKTRQLYESIRDGQLRVPSETAVSHNLPPQPTQFVGRTAELETLDRLIATPDSRLITILGVGGIGKTRLALAAAQRQSAILIEQNGCLTPRFPDGIYFVPLAPLQTPNQILSSMAETLQLRFQPSEQDGRSSQQQLFDYLRQKQLLLVMDNFEHLLDGGDLIAHILQSARNVQILTTSRERLQLRWEHVFPLTGLTYPNADAKTASDVGDAPLMAYTAVQLFQQAASRIQPKFQLSKADEAPLITICQLVEGMPLALELAAAWLETHPLPAIAHLIQQNISTLQTRYHDMPERHRSITAVFDASWQQLTNEEQEALARISIFHDPFSAQAASSVADVTDHLILRLIHKSLLQFNSNLSTTENGRYQLHQLLRQYANGHLTKNEAIATETKNRHAAYFLDFMAKISPELISNTQKSAFSKIEAVRHDVQTAWQWAVAELNHDQLGAAVDTLGRFYARYSRLEEGVSAFSAAVDNLSSTNNPQSKRALFRCIAWLVVCETNSKKALLHCENGLNILGQANPTQFQPEKAHLLLRKGELMRLTGKREQAIKLFEESYQLYKNLGDKWGTAAALSYWGGTVYTLGDYQKGRTMQEDALHLFRQCGDLSNIAYTLASLGDIASMQGDMQQATVWTQEAMDIHRAIGNISGVIFTFWALSVPLFWQGKFSEALASTKKGFELANSLGLETSQEFSFAVNHMHLGNYELSRNYAEQGVIRYREQGDARNETLCLSITGWMALVLGEYQKADEILVRSEATYRKINQRAELGWVQFTRALAMVGLGSKAEAQRFAYDTLITANVTRDFSVGVCSLAGTAVLLCDKPALKDKLKGIELYELAMTSPWVSESKWFADIADVHVTAVSETLPPERVIQAQKQGRNADLWKTITSLIQNSEKKDEG